MKKTVAFGLIFLLLQISASAQLSLPFFDDFARTDDQVDPAKWEAGGGAYLNNHFSENPITKNVVSFNGFSPEGKASMNTIQVYGPVDTLTSKIFNLAGRSPSDSVHLSFYLQTGGIGDMPQSSTGKPVFFQILFKDNNGDWQEARRINAPTANNRTSSFQLYVVPVTDPAFFHSSFQFMFRSIGNNFIGKDTWNLDYVRFQAGPRVTNPQDVATSRRPQPVLKRYTAMPMHQFNIDNTTIASELGDSLFTTLNNLENQIRNTPNFSSIKVGNRPAVVSSNQTLAVPPLVRQLRTNNSAPPASAFAGINGFQTVKSTVFITTSEPNIQTFYNDTISRFTTLHDYYAHDDGSIEDFISVQVGTGTGHIAHRFVANKEDEVKELQVYLPRAGNARGRQINFRIYGVAPDGNPDQNKMTTIPFSVPADSLLDNWFTIPVTPRVLVDGPFFVGWSNSRTVTFTVGLDKNERKNGTIYFTTLTSWGTFSTNPGAIMLRAVMSNKLNNLSVREENLAQQIKVYPNPATDQVTLAGQVDRVMVRNATGQLMLEMAGQPGETRLNLGNLAVGLYLLQVQSKNSTYTHKLILTPKK